MLTGFERNNPSSTAVDMMIRNSRYTFAVAFGLSPDLTSRPCHARTALGEIDRSSARSNVRVMCLSWGDLAIRSGADEERMRGIEPPYSAWEADVLPLNYIREGTSD
jgi:hypothetical protein